MDCSVCAALPAGVADGSVYPPPVEADEWLAADRIRGALVGVAIGDALGGLARAGVPVPEVPVSGSLRTGGATQLTLFTAEGLLRMYVRVRTKGIGPAWAVIRHALERWAFTQGDPFSQVFGPIDPRFWPDGWLVRHHALHARVTGFSAVRAALRSTRDPVGPVLERSSAVAGVTGSDGAGGVVRIAGAGLLFGADDALLVGAMAAAYTHDGVLGRLTGGCLSRVLAGLVRGDGLERAIADAAIGLRDWAGHEPVTAALEALPGTVDSGPPALKALSVGLSAATVRHDEPLQTIRLAVELGGTAAGVVAGAVAGTRSGATGIDPLWRVAPSTAGVLEGMSDAIGVAHRALTLHRQLPGWDSQATWQEDDVEPGVVLLRPRFPGW